MWLVKWMWLVPSKLKRIFFFIYITETRHYLWTSPPKKNQTNKTNKQTTHTATVNCLPLFPQTNFELKMNLYPKHNSWTSCNNMLLLGGNTVNSALVTSRGQEKKKRTQRLPLLAWKTSLFSSFLHLAVGKSCFQGQISTYERNLRAIKGLAVGRHQTATSNQTRTWRVFFVLVTTTQLLATLLSHQLTVAEWFHKETNFSSTTCPDISFSLSLSLSICFRQRRLQFRWNPSRDHKTLKT